MRKVCTSQEEISSGQCSFWRLNVREGRGGGHEVRLYCLFSPNPPELNLRREIAIAIPWRWVQMLGRMFLTLWTEAGRFLASRMASGAASNMAVLGQPRGGR